MIGIQNLHDFPLFVLFDHGALEEPTVFPVELAFPPGRAHQLKIGAALGRCRTGGHQRGAGIDFAVAVHAVDLDGVARFAIELAVAVAVLREVAVDAMHSFFQMDVLQVHRLAEFVRIVEGTIVVFLVEQIALAIVFVDGAEDPAVAVEVGELRVLQGLVELRAADLLQEADVATTSRVGRPARDFASESAAAPPGWDCAAWPGTSARHPSRCPTRCIRSRWSPCSCRGACGRPCTGSTGWSE